MLVKHTFLSIKYNNEQTTKYVNNVMDNFIVEYRNCNYIVIINYFRKLRLS